MIALYYGGPFDKFCLPANVSIQTAPLFPAAVPVSQGIWEVIPYALKRVCLFGFSDLHPFNRHLSTLPARLPVKQRVFYYSDSFSGLSARFSQGTFYMPVCLKDRAFSVCLKRECFDAQKRERCDALKTGVLVVP